MQNVAEIKLDGTHTGRLDEQGIALGRAKKKKEKKAGSGRFRSFVSNLSQGCMVVVAVLPIAGLFLGVGAAIKNASTINSVGYIIGLYMANLGDFIFGNLQVLFAVSIAMAYTKQSAVAAFSAVVGTLVFNGLQSALIIQKMSLGADGKEVANGFYDVLYWHDLPESIFARSLGIFTISSSVFGGIIVAAVTAVCYNKFHAIKLPDVINFFGGTRFVPIIVSFVMIPVSILMCMIWPGIGMLFNIIGGGLGVLASDGNVNALLFGYIERSLVPFGVHHAFYSPLWYTSVGGSMAVDNADANAFIHAALDGNKMSYYAIVDSADQQLTWKGVFDSILGSGYYQGHMDMFMGDQKLWMTINALAGNKVHLLAVDQATGAITGTNATEYLLTFKTFAQSTFNHPAAYVFDKGTSGTGEWALAFPGVDPGQYEQGKFSFMMFGLPAAGVAMVLAAPKQNRKFAASIIISAAFTSFLTGITEPIEFTFLFLSPLLFWGVHAALCAISFWLAAFLGTNMGMTFSGGAIDFVVYGAVPQALGHETSCYIPVIVGAAYIPIYFFTFYWWIKHFDLHTPGRGGTTKLFTKKDYLDSKDKAKAESGASADIKEADIQAYKVLQLVGGIANLADFNACASKLRMSIKDNDLVDSNAIKEFKAIGAFGVEIRNGYIMAVFGGKSDLIATSLRAIIDHKIDMKVLQSIVDGNVDVNTTSDSHSKASGVKENALDRLIVQSPMRGKVVDLSETGDVAFTDKIFGDGIAIIPSIGKVFSPMEGVVKVAFPTGHAYVISKNGVDVMIHIGIDTVNINAKRQGNEPLRVFAPHVKVSDSVKAGTIIADFDIEALKKENYKTVTPVIAISESTTGYELKSLVAPNSNVEPGQPIFELIKK